MLLMAEGAEDAITDTLIKMREAGTPLNTRIIRWTMHAILEEKYPAVLSQLHCGSTHAARRAHDQHLYSFSQNSRS